MLNSNLVNLKCSEFCVSKLKLVVLGSDPLLLRTPFPKAFAALQAQLWQLEEQNLWCQATHVELKSCDLEMFSGKEQ